MKAWISHIKRSIKDVTDAGIRGSRLSQGAQRPSQFTDRLAIVDRDGQIAHMAPQMEEMRVTDNFESRIDQSGTASS